MTDPRPRPQYGEYATPEEQARALGIPAHEAHVSKESTPARHSPPATAHESEAVKSDAVTGDAVTGRAHDGAVQAQARGRSRDAAFTVMLLVLGLVWVLLFIPSASDFVGTLNRTYALQGYTGDYGPVALASAIGLAINISSIALWGITCAVSITVLRRQRRAFYIPLIGAVVTGIVVTALTLVALVNDPGFVAYVTTLQQ